MKISAWAIGNSLDPILFFVVLVMLGIWRVIGLPLTTPTLQSRLSGSLSRVTPPPDEIETEIAVIVEDALPLLAGWQQLSTMINEASAVICLEFATTFPVDRAVCEVRDAVSAIVPDLPAGSDAPDIQREQQEEAPILTYAIDNPSMSLAELT
ncbi:efflux RND transporter permease subunit [Rhodobacteraceae bacterium]|nr:efflux RND transporter permease subunit [Paracoccaceae bacterium]